MTRFLSPSCAPTILPLLAAADGEACLGGYVCVWVQGLEHVRVRSFCLACYVPARRCLGVIPASPRRLDLSCVCHASPYCTRGGCRAAVSVAGALVAQGAM